MCSKSARWPPHDETIFGRSDSPYIDSSVVQIRDVISAVDGGLDLDGMGVSQMT
jgi:hypothetical protein